MTSFDLEQGLWDGVMVMVVMEGMVTVMTVVMVMVLVLVVVMVVVRTNSLEGLLCSQVHGRTWNPWEGAQRGPAAQAVCPVLLQGPTASCALREAEAQLTVVLFRGGSVGYCPLLGGHSGSQRQPGPLLQ